MTIRSVCLFLCFLCARVYEHPHMGTKERTVSFVVTEMEAHRNDVGRTSASASALLLIQIAGQSLKKLC